MMTLRRIVAGLESIPTSTSWYLADLGEALGKQALFTRQSPQRLKVLREHALIESAVSSNRIEGVEVEQKRIGTLVFGKPHLRNRNEEEVQGYRNALTLVHENHQGLPVTEETIKKLHALARVVVARIRTYHHLNIGSRRRVAWGKEMVWRVFYWSGRSYLYPRSTFYSIDIKDSLFLSIRYIYFRSLLSG